MGELYYASRNAVTYNYVRVSGASVQEHVIKRRDSPLYINDNMVIRLHDSFIFMYKPLRHAA